MKVDEYFSVNFFSWRSGNVSISHLKVLGLNPTQAGHIPQAQTKNVFRKYQQITKNKQIKELYLS